MLGPLDRRRVTLFCAFAFGIAWAVSLVIYFTGRLAESPMLVEQAGISLALLLLVVMWAPAIARVLTRLLTREGWQRTYLQRRLKQAWPSWLAAWLLPGLLGMVGMGAFFLLFPRYFDPGLGTLREMLGAQLAEVAVPGDVNLWALTALQVGQALLIAPIVDSPATFGEEFGWRCYLQPRLMALGSRPALVLTGVVWGIWHWPVVLMGHNYGFDYPGARFLGPIAMVWFGIVVGVLLGWLTLRGRSLWPAVIGHAALSGMAALGVVFVRGTPNTLLGPTPVGLIGGLGFTAAAGAILLRPGPGAGRSRRAWTAGPVRRPPRRRSLT